MTTKLPESKLTSDQTIHAKAVRFSDDSGSYEMVAEIRHDDSCRNGHNTFAITAEMWELNKQGRRMGREPVSCGCLHDDIAKRIPDLAPFIKWHLCSTDEPMHYMANTIYQAGDRDHSGKRKGEVTSTSIHVRFGDNPIQHRFGNGDSFLKWLRENGPRCKFDFEIIALHHDPEPDGRRLYKPKYTFGGYPGAEKWYQCPFDSEREAEDFLAALQTCYPWFEDVPTAWSEGKEPQIEAARNAAIWPDATLEQLQDRSALESRLPALMEAFKSDVESLGLVY